MMTLLPAFIGIIGLLQGALNKQIGVKIGVAQAVLINMILTLIFSVGFYLLTLNYPKLMPEIFRIKTSISTWQWWYIWPGVLGLLIVALVPWAISEVGMVKFTIILVASQMIFSCFWDVSIENIPLNSYKILGMFLCLIGTAFIVYKR
ncbi:MAG: DMT family transporter [Bdellovibrionales bacterium]|jgi:transporter family-2 protein|nr:DMT family transporter [Bdellovibrionales bacterium]